MKALIRLAKQLHRLLRITSFRVWHYVVPIVLFAMVASIDALSIAIVVPLANGIAQGTFEPAWEMWGLRHLLEAFPGILLWPESPNKSTFMVLVSLVVLLALVAKVLELSAHAFCHYRNGVYMTRIRDRVFSRILTFGKEYFDRTSQGRISKILGYANSVLRVLEVIQSTILSSLKIISYGAILWVTSWRLTLLILVTFPILHVATTVLVRAVRRIAVRLRDENLHHGRQVFNMLSGILLIKAKSQEQQMAAEHRRLIDSMRVNLLKLGVLSSAGDKLQQILINLALLGTALGAVLLADSDHTEELSTFCAFLIIARRTVPMFGFLNSARIRLSELHPQLQVLVELLDDEGKFIVHSGPRTYVAANERIEVRDLTFKYSDGTKVLNNLSLTLPVGKQTAIVGRTGCGKTTLLNLLIRLYDCPEGTIFVDGIDIREYSLESLRRSFALVDQDAIVMNDSVRMNLTFGLSRDVDDAELWAALESVEMADKIRALTQGLSSDIGDRGVLLSGGERQRVSLARALLSDADVLILDEATSALDTKTEHIIAQTLERQWGGKTVVIVAHRLSTVRRCDRIVMLTQGTAAESGTWEELMANAGAFNELWEAQSVDLRP